MEHTSDENIARIINFNNCKSFKELQSRQLVQLNLCDLDGYINISDFSRGAYNLHIRCRHPELKRFENYFGDDSKLKIQELLQKLNCKVDLDASYAGDFIQWGFDNNFEHFFINSITLRHPNQVWHFGNNPFRVKNDSLYLMTKAARLAARDRNIENYLTNLEGNDILLFAEHLKNLQKYNASITELKKQTDRIIAIIEQLKSKVRKNEQLVTNLKNIIFDEIKNIATKNGNSKNPISLKDISKIKLETLSDDYDPGSEQNFSYEFLSKKAKDNMAIENEKWYQALSEKTGKQM